MTTLREAAQQALEALEFMADEWGFTQKASRFERWRAIEALRAALAQQEPEHQPGCALLQIPSRDCDCRQEAEPTRAQQMRDAGYTRRPTLREMAQQEEHIGQNLQSRLDAALLLEERRQEIAQPRRETEQEPVAWRDPATDDIVSVARRAAWETDYGLGGKDRAATYTEPLYTAPPRREWRNLTMQEINALPEVGGRMWNMGVAEAVLRAIRAVEAALKERNNG